MLEGELSILRRYPLEKIKQALMQRACTPAKNTADFVSILYRLGEWNAGFQEAEEAKSRLQDEPSLDFFTGLYWLKREDYRRALTDFKRCDQAPEPNGAVLNNIGAIHLLLDKPDLALSYFNRALELHSNYMDAQINKNLLQCQPIEPGKIKFTWRELRPIMISYVDE